VAVESGSRRRLAHRGAHDRHGARDLNHRLALLELGSLERPRFHRPAGDHDLREPLEAAAVDAGSPLRGRPDALAQLRRRRVRLPGCSRATGRRRTSARPT
jgi:hypothetical protein